MKSRLLFVTGLGLGLVSAAAVLVAHSLAFNFVTDDAFISFIYSRNLAQHGQLVFNVGEKPVEGYTNFLWTVLLGALLKLGLAPELTSRVLGTAFAVATFGTLAWLSRRARGGDYSAWDALPALILAGVPGYACWASGGLETQMFTFFVTLGAAWHVDEILHGAQPRPRTAVAFAVAALTRPEGALLFAVTALHRGLVKLARRQLGISAAELRWLGCFVLMVAPHFLWRRWYYGWWFPNTYYIKSASTGETWQQGGYYLLRAVEQLHLWVVPIVVVVGLVVGRQRGLRVLAAYATLMVAVFAVYVASVGGDFMGLHRFVVPVIPLVVVVTALALRAALARLPAAAAVGGVTALLAAHAWHAVVVDKVALEPGPADHGIDTPGYLKWYTQDRALIGKWFATIARPDDYAAVGGAGAQVYYSGMRSLDCYGLNDEFIAHQVRPRSSRPGHQKYAPDAYTLSKGPTIITSNIYHLGYEPVYAWPNAAGWAQRGYHYVTVQVPGLRPPYYSFLLRNDRQLPERKL